MPAFAQQAAIVTGAASGIGKATALRLASGGACVVVADVNEQGACTVADSINAEGGRAVAHAVDVTDASAVAVLAERAVREFGKIDILVSNAGWDRAGPFADTDPEFWDRVIAINYRGHLATCHAVLPFMREQGHGRIVTVASDAGRVGSSGEVVYSGAKGAVIAFTKGLAREVARYGINVNCVAPGLVDTPLLAGIVEGNEKLIAAIVRTIPLGRTGTPEEIAAAICFFASPDATYITGQTLSVNGGLTML
ncbi:MAG TPA: SDR family NAD(P)-dependent oxidoreductase [Candidatus Dormibacteraeota bacterium]|nr:SDR family NAD(P)-dependent oxidoreductase [Candidatus Dormibacteraeota bacterium]